MLLRDFLGYWEFSLNNMMPSQRHEFYLAQIAYVAATAMGGYKGHISDFMLNKRPTHTTKHHPTNPKDNPLFKNFNPIKKPRDK